MKNILIIDGAENCAYDIFAVPDEKFNIIFPAKGQNIEFIEDVDERYSKTKLDALFNNFWDCWIPKQEAHGIDGILFYELEDKKRFYPNKIDCDLDGWARANQHSEFYRKKKELYQQKEKYYLECQSQIDRNKMINKSLNSGQSINVYPNTTK